VRVIPVGLRDVVAIDARDHGAFFGKIVAVDAHQHERGNDQQEQQEHHDFGVLADGF